jgi:uncharacterized lipoprotein YddW (UPF0748 family)
VHLFRFYFTIFGALFLVCIGAANSSASPRYGLWVEAEGQNQPFSSRENFDRYLEFTSEGKFSDLYCQVYRRGRSWFPSMMADDTPYRESIKEGFDTLGDTIKTAHSRGQKVHAWVNALRILDNPEAPLFKVIGREAALSDSKGNNLLDYDKEGRAPGEFKSWLKLGTPGVWLESSSQRVRQYLLETIRDVIVAYPELDGIHLDMIRMPLVFSSKPKRAFSAKTALGFVEEAVRRYHRVTPQVVTSLDQKEVDRLVKSDSYWNWRRAQITLFVYQVRKLMDEIAPTMELSVAVLPSARNAYLYANQDWPEWMSENLVHTVVPMAYSKNLNKVGRYSEYAVRHSKTNKSRVLVGLGAWLMKRKGNMLVRQGEVAMESGADGVVLFSYSNLLPPKGPSYLIESLSNSLFAVPGK